MNDYLKKLDRFFDSNDNCMLVDGPWGVGKTFLVNEWADAKKNTTTVYSLSLFGISNAEEMYSSLLCGLSKWNAIKRKIKQLDQNIEVGVGPVSVAIPAIGLFNLLLNEKKYRPKKKAIVIIDDIDRPDNKLSVEEIFGCVDALRRGNVKVILIANTEKLSNKDGFMGFKEKVIDEEMRMEVPTETAIEAVLGPDLESILRETPYFKLSNNLRTLSFLRKKYEQDFRSASSTVIKATYLCLLTLRELRFSKNEYIKKEIDMYNRFLREMNRDEKTLNIEIAKKTEELNKEVANDLTALTLIVQEKRWIAFDRKEELSSFMRRVYECVSRQTFSELLSIKPPQSRLFTRDVPSLSSKVLYSASPADALTKAVQVLEDYVSDSGCDIAEIVKEYASCVYCASIYSEQQVSEGFLNSCAERIAIEINEIGPRLALIPFSVIESSYQAVLKGIRTKAKTIAAKRKGTEVIQSVRAGETNIGALKEYWDELTAFETDKSVFLDLLRLNDIATELAKNVIATLDGEIDDNKWETARNVFYYLGLQKNEWGGKRLMQHARFSTFRCERIHCVGEGFGFSIINTFPNWFMSV